MAQINKPSEYFNTVLYTGNGADRSITGVGFKPDFLWAKNRSGATAFEHRLCNSTTGSKNVLFSSQTFAEQVDQYGTVDSFDADGFSITTGTTNSNYMGLNVSGDEMVTWHWKANGGTTSSNTDGSITSTVQANTTSGFSIVSYTGNNTDSTIGHGLGQKPDFIMVKERDSSSYDWVCYHSALGAGYAIALNLSDAAYGATGWNNGTEPTSTVFSVDSAANSVNKSGSGFIAYCFSEKKGFSKAFSYTGNGSTDGSFCYLGMKAKFIMIKRTDSTGDWVIYDGVKEPYNVIDTYLEANSSNADTTLAVRELDILSNGFKVRGTNTSINASGSNYIGIAFAENPLVGTNNVVGCAR